MPPLDLSATDLTRLRFAQSPLVEVVECLWMLASGRIRAPFLQWHRQVRGRLRTVDTALLGAVIPGQPVIADWAWTPEVLPARCHCRPPRSRPVAMPVPVIGKTLSSGLF